MERFERLLREANAEIQKLRERAALVEELEEQKRRVEREHAAASEQVQRLTQEVDVLQTNTRELRAEAVETEREASGARQAVIRLQERLNATVARVEARDRDVIQLQSALKTALGERRLALTEVF